VNEHPSTQRSTMRRRRTSSSRRRV
jgi:hypothetical protein